MNDERNRTTKSRKNQNSGEKETYKYLGKFKAETDKQAEIKEKIIRNISGE